MMDFMMNGVLIDWIVGLFQRSESSRDDLTLPWGVTLPAFDAGHSMVVCTLLSMMPVAMAWRVRPAVS